MTVLRIHMCLSEIMCCLEVWVSWSWWLEEVTTEHNGGDENCFVDCHMQSSESTLRDKIENKLHNDITWNSTETSTCFKRRQTCTPVVFHQCRKPVSEWELNELHTCLDAPVSVSHHTLKISSVLNISHHISLISHHAKHPATANYLLIEQWWSLLLWVSCSRIL